MCEYRVYFPKYTRVHDVEKKRAYARTHPPPLTTTLEICILGSKDVNSSDDVLATDGTFGHPSATVRTSHHMTALE